MNSVINKTIVAQFYKINTGFFLVLFILLFGLLNGQATIDLHYGIMQSISGTLGYMVVAMIIWMVYGVKCIFFGIKELNNPSNTFLYTMQSVNNRSQFISWLACYAMLLLPVLVYGSMTIVVGIGHGHWLLPVLFAVFQVGLCAAGAFIYFRTINSIWKKPTLVIPSFFSNTKKTFLFYLLHFSLQTRKSTFVGIKLLSLLLLQAMLLANASELNKESICVLIMFLISAHALLPVYYFRFMEVELAFMRNLPLPIMRQYLAYVFTYAIIFLPELIFLFVNGHGVLPVSLVFSLYAVAIAQLTLFTSLQYIGNMTTERFTMIVFGFFFGSMLFLASFNLWLLCIVEVVLSILIFKKYKFSHFTTIN